MFYKRNSRKGKGLQKGILKEGLTRTILAVGGKDVKAAN
jgi:hypothetical protein